MKSKIETFNSWWKGSKYSQVIFPKENTYQISLDGFTQGVDFERHKAADLVLLLMEAHPYTFKNKDLFNNIEQYLSKLP